MSNEEAANNNKEDSNKNVSSISANNMEEIEQDNKNREPEQIAIKDILNSSAQNDKERQDINSENNEQEDNSKQHSSKDFSSISENIMKETEEENNSGCLNRMMNPF